MQPRAALQPRASRGPSAATADVRPSCIAEVFEKRALNIFEAFIHES